MRFPLVSFTDPNKVKTKKSPVELAKDDLEPQNSKENLHKTLVSIFFVIMN